MLFRVGKGGQAFLVKDTYKYRDVLTNSETGEWFVIRGKAVFHEIKATQVSGDIYEFTAIEAGQPFVIEDSDGNVVVRDRGVIRRTALFPTPLEMERREDPPRRDRYVRERTAPGIR